MQLSKTLTCGAFAVFILAGCAPARPEPASKPARPSAAMTPVVDADRAARPPFAFSAEDAALLEEVQHGAFRFLWESVEEPSGMVRDRSSKPVVSVAGVGFQLAGIPVGVEHGWITREQGEARVLSILRTLEKNSSNRKAGMFFHYVDGKDGGPSAEGYETVASTIDGALLMAGMIVAGEYFNGEAKEISRRLFGEVDWAYFVAKGDRFKPSERGFVSLAWKPKDGRHDPTGAGELAPYVWMDAGDEQKLVNFLGVCAPEESRRLDPATYYRLRRRLGSDAGGPPFVWFPWSGALFTDFFAHCYINYAAIGPDDPAALGVERRPSVDWWVNSLRAVKMHERKGVVDAKTGVKQWGLSASDAPSGYEVPGLFPVAIGVEGLRADFDYHPGPAPKDSTKDNTFAPYAPGCSVMFDPVAAVTTLRAYRGLKGADGSALVWKDPSVTGPGGAGHYGFQDAFNLTHGPNGSPGPWVAPDCVAIDQGPLLLSIENARTGLVWKLFHASPVVQGGMSRLKLSLPGNGAGDRNVK